MNKCCRCAGIETEFDRETADADLAHYHKKGPDKTTRILLDLLRPADIEESTLLDIGGGVGVIPNELIAAGARHATYVDASPAYRDAAREEALHSDNASRIDFHLGDFVELASEIPPAEIVILHRVLCCYPDVQQLVRLSAGRARKIYAVTYPRDTWWMRLTVPAIPNLFFRLRRSAFRVYLHATAEVDALIRSEGLRLLSRQTTFLWQIVVYERPQ